MATSGWNAIRRRRPLFGVTALVVAVAGTVLVSRAISNAAVAPTAASPAVAAVATPPMGWASWNSFAAQINSNVIKAQTDALVSAGLKDAGYQYVYIDEGWWQGTRDSGGNITVDTGDWPGGMQAIADYIHSKGLKAGIYTNAGRDGCGYYYPTGRPAAPGSGSEGHYDQDFLQFSKWGFDFVKVDWCGGSAEGLDARTAYQAISSSIDRATAQTGRPMALSICNWGNQNPWDWAPTISTMWRTSQDIIYWGERPSMSRALTNFDAAQHPSTQSAGHYNDPDMLIVGMPGFTAAQNRTHLGLWAISGAPLLAGNNLATMDTTTRGSLTNREVIAVDQDPLGRQGTKVAEAQTGLQVYNKILVGGNRAVLLLNRTNTAAAITARWTDLGLSGPAAVRNLWTATGLGTFSGSYATSVPANEAVLLTVAATGSSSSSSSSSSSRPGSSGSGSSSGGSATGCRVAYTTSDWDTGFTANVTVTNTAATAVNGWSLRWTFPGNQVVSSAWNATVVQSGTQATATNASYNSAISPGGTVSFGFQATYSGTNPHPEAFTLNGAACAVA